MLELVRLNDEKVWINPDQIKMIFSSPDTTLVFTDGSSLMVKNSVEEIRDVWLQFRRQIVSGNGQIQQEKQP